MRYFKFRGSAAFCGTEFEDHMVLDDNITDGELDEIAGDLAYENAESYEYLATGWEEDFESEEDRESYYESSECYWEEISKKEYEDYYKDMF